MRAERETADVPQRGLIALLATFVHHAREV
jgi:hypothetical protein